MFYFALKTIKNMPRILASAYLICYNIHKENKNKMVYQTKKEKESLMKAATYVSAGNLQLLDQAHHPPLQTLRS